MRKLIAMALCLGMLCVGFTARAERAMDALNIGVLGQLSGDFFTDMWGNNAADMDVRALIHGQSTVAFNGVGNFALDMSVLRDIQLSDDEQGNRTYLFTLNDALAYSDGSALTAKDYAFSALLLADPRMTDLGSVPGAMAHLVGFEEYVSGVRQGDEKACFSGVRLLSERQFSITVSGDFLPYYYELTLANVQPYPIAEIAPGCDIQDDGDGAYITGPFGEEMLKKSVLDPDNGYRYYPKLTSGPYVLDGYDRESHVATLHMNPNYPGNYEGQKPSIQYLTIQTVNQGDAIDQLLSGELDLVNKVSSGDRINQGLEESRNGLLSASNYMRAGLSYLSFACERGPAQSLNVRKAVAMCVDEEALTDRFLKGFGLVSYGFYGYGQWMADAMGDDVLQLARYALNPNAAIGLLEQDGWTLREDGAPYDDELGGVRFRKAGDGTLEKLAVSLAIPDNSEAGNLLEELIAPPMARAGFELSVTRMPYSELLKHYYRHSERTYDMFFTATNFNLVFDPYYTFSTDPVYQGVFNTTGIMDEELMQLADEMRRTAAEDEEGYSEKWFEFQKRFVEVLPMVPLYSNVYFDFFRPDLIDYRPNANWSFASALLYAYLGEPKTDELNEAGAQSEQGLETMDDGWIEIIE